MVSVILLFGWLFSGGECVLVLKSGTVLQCESYQILDEWVIVQLAPGFKPENWNGPSKFKIRKDKLDWQKFEEMKSNLKEEEVPHELIPKEASLEAESAHPRRNADESLKNTETQIPSATQRHGADERGLMLRDSLSTGDSAGPEKQDEPESDDDHAKVGNAGFVEKEEPEVSILNSPKKPAHITTGSYALPLMVKSWLTSNEIESVTVLEQAKNAMKILVKGHFSGQETATLHFEILLMHDEEIMGRDDFYIEVTPDRVYNKAMWINLNGSSSELKALVTLKDFF